MFAPRWSLLGDVLRPRQMHKGLFICGQNNTSLLPASQGRRSPQVLSFQILPSEGSGYLAVCSPNASSESSSIPEQRQHTNVPRARLQRGVMDGCFLERAP